jgi:hypothetical protein
VGWVAHLGGRVEAKVLTGRQPIWRGAPRSPACYDASSWKLTSLADPCQKLGLTMSNGDVALQLSHCSSLEFFAWTK